MKYSPVSKKRVQVGGVLSLIAMLAISSASTAIAADSSKKGGEVPLGLVLEFVPGEKDRAVYKVIQKTLEENSEGVWSRLREQGVQYISPQEATVRALRKNLTLRIGSADAAKAAMVIQQAEAIFDPVFSVSLGRAESFTYDRGGIGPVFLKKNNVMLPAGYGGQDYIDLPPPALGLPPIPVKPGQPRVVRMGYTNQVAGLVPSLPYNLSSANTRGDESYSGSLSVNQQLPWGSQLQLTHSVSVRMVDYDSMGNSYDVPYASALGANVFVPLPGMKGFGRFAPQEVQQEQAKLTRERGDLVLRVLVENILLQVDLAYWGLVQSLENLVAAIDNRHASQEQASYAARMLDLGRTTQDGKNQRDAELARARVNEEMARDALINASYALVALMESDQDLARSAVFLPAGYQDRLSKEITVDGKTAHKIAVEQRLEPRIGQVDVASRDLNLHYMENQALPDFGMTANFNLAQDNSKYGYRDYIRSVGNIGEPDSLSYGLNFAYRRPIGNRAAVAGVAQAQDTKTQSELSAESTSKDVTKEVEDALANVESARIRKKSAKRNEELAALTLAKLRDRADAVGDVAELEITLKLRDLLKARTSRISATVDAKKAETRLLAAQGIVAETFAEKAALNEFDQYRIQLLAESKAVPFFSAFSFGDDEKAGQ